MNYYDNEPSASSMDDEATGAQVAADLLVQAEETEDNDTVALAARIKHPR
jgi:hypothetical protein